MKRLAAVLFALAIWVSPGMLHASLFHKTHTKVVRHPVVSHPRTRHYTRKAQQHRVVRHRVRHYTRKAHFNKAARRLHKAHNIRKRAHHG
jgi:hypothetical protein